MPLNLLGLPHELLDRIVELVLIHRDLPAANNGLPPENRISRRRERYAVKCPSYGSRNVKYYNDQEALERNWKSAPLRLLLVCRKMAEITRRRLQQASKASDYHMDVLVVNETEVWPTWTFLTPPCKHVDSVTATVRFDGTSPTLDARRYGFSRYDISYQPYKVPPRIVWCLYYLMERFLESGPLEEHRLPPRYVEKTYPFTINKVTLDVQTPPGRVAPEGMEYDYWLRGRDNEDPSTSSTGPYNAVETLMIRPEWLVKILDDWIGELLRSSYYMEHLDDLVFDTIGSIRLCVDGVLVKEYSVDLCMQEYIERERVKLDKFDLAAFHDRVRKRYHRRKAAGLPVDHSRELALFPRFPPGTYLAVIAGPPRRH